MRIVNLILYSDTPQYNLMRDYLRSYLRTIPNLTYYFYRFEPALVPDHIITGDTLLIRGKESRNPGILRKTIRAFELMVPRKFDYIIRTNISTVVDFNMLQQLLHHNPITYGGREIEYPSKAVI